MKPKWIPCSERLPLPTESHEGYFWCWDENNPGEPPGILEAWEQDGTPKGFCHEACGVCPHITHWMRIDPPKPPRVKPEYVALFITDPQGTLKFEADFGGYARQPLPINTDESIMFPECTSSPCTITWAALVNTPSGEVGTMKEFMLNSPVLVSIGTRLILQTTS